MKITFSLVAIIIIFLPMIPNIMYFKAPPKDLPETLGNRIKIIEFLENGSRMISFILMLFLSQTPNPSINSPWAAAGLIFLLLYFGMWGRYFKSGGDHTMLSKGFIGIPAPMAIFPVSYFICAAVWLNSFVAVITLIIFGIAHILSVHRMS